VFTLITLSQSFVWEVVIGLNLNLQNKIGYGLEGSKIVITIKDTPLQPWHLIEEDVLSLFCDCLVLELNTKFKIMLH
jgi:hypothetical protein